MRMDALAQDVAIHRGMTVWSEDQLDTLFESGGRVLKTTPAMRLLCLHSGSTHARAFEYQLRHLRDALGDGAEWTFINGFLPMQALDCKNFLWYASEPLKFQPRYSNPRQLLASAEHSDAQLGSEDTPVDSG